jgi:hypothetical protein
VEVNGCGLIGGTIPEFAWRDWGKYEKAVSSPRFEPRTSRLRNRSAYSLERDARRRVLASTIMVLLSIIKGGKCHDQLESASQEGRTVFCGVQHDPNYCCRPVCVQRNKNIAFLPYSVFHYCIVAYYATTEQVGPSANASDLYSGYARFESHPGHQLSQGFSWSPSVTTEKCQDRLLPHPF